MPSFIVPSRGGGALGLGAGGSAARKLVVSVTNVIGNIGALLLTLAPVLSFVVPICNEQAVSDRTAYGHIVTMFSSVVWFLYAAPDYPAAVYSMGVNTFSTVLQLVYVAVFLRFAAGVGRRHALYAFAPILTASTIMTVLVFTKVIWGSQFVAYVAAIAAFSAYCSVAIDVVEAMRSRDVNNMDPLLEVLLGLVNASASTISGFFSTPPDFFVAIPNVIGVPVLLAQVVVYVMHCNPQPELNPQPEPNSQPEPNPPPPEQERDPVHTVDVPVHTGDVPNYTADLHTLFACQV